MEYTESKRKKKGMTLGAIVLAASMGLTSPKAAYSPQETMQGLQEQKIGAAQTEEQAIQAEQEKKPKSTDGLSYVVDCPDCPGMYAYFKIAQNTYFLLPHNKIYEITIMPGDSFNRWQENEGWPKNYPPKSTQLLIEILRYVNKEPFDPINLVAGQTMRVVDFDGDDSVMKRSMEFYGKRLTAEEMQETIKHNDEYDDKVNKK